MSHTRPTCTRYLPPILVSLVGMLGLAGSLGAQPIIPDPDAIPRASEALALTDVRIVIRPGEVIERGTVVVRRGLIESVGSGSSVPFDARRIDGSGLTVYAGFIDGYSSAGMPKPEEMRGDVERPGDPPPARAGMTPERHAHELFDRNAGSVDSLRRAGFALAHVLPRGGFLPGQGSLMLLGADDTARYLFRPDVTLGMTFDGANNVYPATPMGIIATIRNLFTQARLQRRHDRAHRDDPQGMVRATGDPIRGALYGTIDGTRPLMVGTEDDLEVRRALMIGRELDLPIMIGGLDHAPDVLDLLIGEETPTFLSLNFPRDPEKRKMSESDSADSDENLPAADSTTKPKPTDLTEYRKLDRRTESHEHLEGERLRLVTVRDESRQAHLAFPQRAATAGLRYGFGTAGVRSGAYRAKILEAVGAGLDPERALRALTVDAAALLGLSKAVGTVERGKIANLVVTRGDYFEDSSKVVMTIVDGLLYDYRDELKEKEGKKKREDRSDRETPHLLRAAETGEMMTPGRRVALEREGNGTVLIRNGTLLTITDGVRENTDLLIREGMIDKIGSGLSAPSGATVIDAEGKYVMPGIIDAHSHIAVSGPVNEWTSPVTAEVRIGDVIDPYDITIYRALAGGVTTSHVMHGSANPIGGECETIKHRYGEVDPELMKMKDAPRTIKFALGENPTRVHGRGFNVSPSTRMGVEQVFRKAFTDASRYMKEWEAYNGASESKQGRMVPPVYDERLETLAAILRGEILIHCHSYRADEIVMLLGVLRDFGIEKITFQHANEGFKVARELAEFGASASVFSDWWAYKFEVYYSTAYNAAILTRNGVTTSINSDSPELNRHLFHEAAKSMRNGDLTEEECLAMITINPARQLGIEDRVGSLEVGKEGDVAIFDRHPLSVYTKVTHTLVDGIIRFDAENDPDDMRLLVNPEEQIDEVHDHEEDGCMEGVGQ